MRDKKVLHTLDRRDFLKKTALGAGVTILPGSVVGTSLANLSPNDRVNVAIVGVAGRGQSAAIASQYQNVVALCDVDEERVAKARNGRTKTDKQFNKVITSYEKKGARWYSDYRVMFEELGDKIDAVIISTPDHMHFPIAMTAMNLGKHVYCEAPLAHTVEETEILIRTANANGTVTQMGNQGHSNPNTNLIRQWIHEGLFGDIREVHSWTNRSAIWWKKSVPNPGYYKPINNIPTSLNWENWLGVASHRSYDPDYLPTKWRAYSDFGNSVLGDMGCHLMDKAYWGLELNVPDEIEASTLMNNCYPFPVASTVTFSFPKRGSMPPVTYKWYEGGIYPSLQDVLTDDNTINEEYRTNASLLVGEGRSILFDTCANRFHIFPESYQRELNQLDFMEIHQKTNRNHYQDFFNAIRESGKASSDFSYAGPLTKTVLLGRIAQRVNRKLKYDKSRNAFVNNKEANSLLKKEYPKGWILS